MNSKKHVRNIVVAASVVALGITVEALGQGGPEHHFGFKHTPLGEAVLTTAGCSDCLVISNIGSSGQDGVRIEFGEVDVFRWSFDMPQHAPASVDGSAYIASPADSSGNPLGTVAATDVGDHFDVHVDYTPIGATGVVVILVDELGNTTTSTHSGNDVVGGAGAVPESVGTQLAPNGQLCVMYMWSDPVPVVIGTNPPVNAVRMMMISQGAAESQTEQARQITVVQDLAPGQPLGSLTIVDEHIVMFGNRHRALGDAHLYPPGIHPPLASHGRVVVSNIGASGDDGVEIEPDSNPYLAPNIGGEARVEFGDGIPLPPGSVLAIEGLHAASDGTSNTFMVGEARRTASGFEVWPDFSPAGASTFDVELFNGDSLVDAATGLSGMACSGGAAFPEVWIHLCAVSEQSRSTLAGGEHEIEFDIAGLHAAPLQIPGHAEVLADRIHITATPSGPPPGGQVRPSQVKVLNMAPSPLAGGSNTFEISGNSFEAIQSACQKADIDESGGVTVTDLLALLSAWGPCAPPCPPTCAADINGDCVVNVSDLLALLAAWGPCD